MANDGRSLEELLAERTWVRALALSLVGDEHRADDLVQEASVRALTRPPRDACSPGGWMATVIRNLARDAARGDGRRRGRERAVARRPSADATADVVARAEAHRRVTAAVMDLDEPFRTVVLLRFYDGLAPREIAERLGITAATARTRLHRGLERLRGRLRSDDPHNWSAALAPLAWRAVDVPVAPPLSSSSTLARGGALVATKKHASALVILLLLLLGGGGAVLAWNEGETEPRDTGDRAAADAHVAQRRRVRSDAADAPDPAPAGNARVDAETLSAAAPAEETPRLLTLESLIEIPSLEPVTPLPSTTTADDENDEVDAAGASFVMAPGPDSPWAMVPPHGDASVTGRVLDARGRPIAGASLLRIWIDDDEQPIYWGKWIRFDVIAKTDDRGRFVAEGQPSYPFLLQADFHAKLRKAGGQVALEGAQRVHAADGGRVAVPEFRLPIEPDRFGAVEGRLMDTDGNPIGGHVVGLGDDAMHCDQEGRFRFPFVEPGTLEIRSQAWGYVNEKQEIDLSAGETETVEFRIPFDNPGDLTLAGRVVDQHGSPIADTIVYFVSAASEGRHAKTDAQGRYRIDGIPTPADGFTTRVHVNGAFDEDVPFEDVRTEGVSVPQESYEIVVRRLAKLRVELVDALDGAPVELFNIDADATEVVDGREATRRVRSLKRWSETGDVVVAVPDGQLTLTIHAQGYRSVEARVGIPGDLAPSTLRVALNPR